MIEDRDPSRGPAPVPAAPAVRPVLPADLPRIAELMHEHIAYERSAPVADGLAGRLHEALFGPGADPARRILAAIGPDGRILGYAACAPEFAFWEARSHLHLDCLYLAEDARGHGLGAALVAAVAELARELGMAQVQWQTPEWNEGAVRFYRRLGADFLPKLRFRLPVSD
ncbi:GNAT family N-acetyltransferase [Streptomyces sp. NPDC097619]|uniref:GNAT family N-acetyltransferase n=1 Tax=Streptomyces sp. NPDC097619 TaxID=3157228 RepID=UPI003322B74A